MRSWLIAGAILLVVSVSGLADEKNQQQRVKPYHAGQKPQKSEKSDMKSTTMAVPHAKTGGASKELSSAEKAGTKKPKSVRSAKKVRAAAKLPKEKNRIPPINFGGNGGKAKGAGLIKRDKNPYKGRLKQKGGHH
jgi:hypothetical protein